MNPPVVVNQFRAATVLLLVCALSDSLVLQHFALWAAVLLSVWWILAKTQYAWSAGSIYRSADRYLGDRAIAKAALVQAALTAAASALVLRGVTALEIVPTRELGVPDEVVASCALFAVSLHTSSLVDWYWVRPRRDGIIGSPVCFDPSVRRRKLITRVLLVHRTICTFAVGFFASVIVYSILKSALSLIPPGSFWSGYADNVSGPIGLAVFFLIGYRGGLFEVAKIVAGATRAKFGDTVTADLGHQVFRGKVFEVSLEGLTLVATNGDKHLAPLGGAGLVVHQTSPEDHFCPRQTPAGEHACGGLDEDEKCQFGKRRRLLDEHGRESFKPTPKPHVPVRLFGAW